VTERELQKAVATLAERLGWRVAELTSATRTSGFPDLALIYPPRLVFVKPKNARKNPDFAEATWLNSLDEIPNVESYVWRPEDLVAGRVEYVLRYGP